ncbi:MAG: hypothetical protein CML98_02100 [Rhodobiaceae bacterium]|nr:hypothetical protein [Rhodobiaceae bacterium]|tara:strand:- start:8392 stop:8940 length:549 start_codon:yes stop_codon:yes gene_type:complete
MKLVTKIFGITLFPSTVFAAGQKSAGLPQMDISTFPSQLFWLIVTFLVLYLFMSKYVIPSLRTTIEERKDKILDDINDAEAVNNQASLSLKEYDDKLNGAGIKSSELISEAKDKSSKYADDLKNKSNENINQMIEESVKRIKSQQKDSENQVKQATLEAVKSIVSKYIENVPSDDEISKKLN